jgi:hypothetical protein
VIDFFDSSAASSPPSKVFRRKREEATPIHDIQLSLAAAASAIHLGRSV